MPSTLAILGGQPLRTRPFPSWPVFDQTEERAVLDTLRSGKWYRGTGKMVDQFQDHSNTWETWYDNGYLFTGDLSRGMDVLKLK